MRRYEKSLIRPAYSTHVWRIKQAGQARANAGFDLSCSARHDSLSTVFYYCSVVSWELPGLFVIGVFQIIALLWTNQLMISIMTVIILSIVSIWFGFLVSRMSKLS